MLDTRVSPEYVGKASKALKMLETGDCDAIITYGQHYQCIKWDDAEIGRKMREFSLKSFEGAVILYILVARTLDGERVCYANTNEFSSDFKRARFCTTMESATSFMRTLRRKVLECDIERGSLHVEEYLYHDAVRCPLRIYYEMSGLFSDKGLLAFIKQQVEAGVLYPRCDSRGKLYVMLEDLLIFKGQLIQFTNPKGIHYSRVFDLRLLLHDGLIAFDGVHSFVEKHPEIKAPALQHLIKRDGANERVFYDLGELFYTDDTVYTLLCEEYYLGSWG